MDLKSSGRFEPVQQVMARIELAGPGRQRPVSTCAATARPSVDGPLRRTLIEQLPRESAYDALRRSLEPG